MTAATAALAPIVKTDFAHRITHRGGGVTKHRECWGAKTTDGVWEFEREESSGTPWLIWHRPSLNDKSLPHPVIQCGTLLACRRYVADGTAARMLETRKAEWAKEQQRLDEQRARQTA